MMSPLSFILWAFILFMTFSFKRITNKLSPNKLPPGPSPLPIFGSLFKLGNQPHRSLAELAAKHGPIMALKLGSVTTVVISSSDLAKRVLIKGDLSTPFVLDAVYAHQHDEYSVAWLPASSPKWRALRRIYGSYIFCNVKLDCFQELRHQKVAELLDRVRDCSEVGFEIDISKVVLNLFYEIMLSTIFSGDLGGHSSGEIEKLVVAVIEETRKPNLVDCFPMLHLLDPQGIRRRLTNHCRRLFKVFDDIMDSRLRAKRKRSGDGVMAVLLDFMEKQRDGINREFDQHTLLDLFGAGMDTTSKAIEWAMAELINHPETLQRAQRGLEETVGKGKVVEESDITKLPYMQAILKETFRLHPPVPILLPRKIEKDVEVSGYIVPEGSRMLLNIWAIGRDPRNWPNPDSFVPDRFLNTNIDVKGQHFGLIPFGAGKRICPGMPLVLRTIPVVIASLINGFDWKKLEGGRVETMQDGVGITLKMVKPLRLTPPGLSYQRFLVRAHYVR